MISLEGQAAPRVAFRPTIKCLPLPFFDSGHYYEVLSAFSAAVPLKLGQAWRKNVEPDFAPGQVRVGWRGDSLLMFAEMIDKDIFTGATKANQRMWELGDTFEIFLQPAIWLGYMEFHITPNNLHLQKWLPDSEVVEKLRLRGVDGYRLNGKVFRSCTWVHANANLWSVYAEIPARILGETVRSLCGCRWRFSFSRYDYTRRRKEPVISSTSPHAKADFHRQQEWGELIFETSASS